MARFSVQLQQADMNRALWLLAKERGWNLEMATVCFWDVSEVRLLGLRCRLDNVQTEISNG